MNDLLRLAFKILFILFLSFVYFLMFYSLCLNPEKIILLGNFYFTINTIFFPVLISMLQSFAFPPEVKIKVVRRIKSDIQSILVRTIVTFVLTTITSLPLVLFDDVIKNMKKGIKYVILSVILGFLTSSIIYYIRRFYKLFLLKESIDAEILKEQENA